MCWDTLILLEMYNWLFLTGSDKELVGVSWQMENYFQAEAYNLDKVLDEFEQNEGE